VLSEHFQAEPIAVEPKALLKLAKHNLKAGQGPRLGERLAKERALDRHACPGPAVQTPAEHDRIGAGRIKGQPCAF